MRKVFMTAAIAALAVTGVAGCDSGGSAVETRDRADAPAAATQDALPVLALATTAAPETTAARPAVTANRRETADEKIVRLFQRNGADFGASDADEYGRMVQAFISRPPPGTEQVTRANGDVILYQASTNTFAVVDRRGVPRTMFKPREGAAYWDRQKAAAPEFGRRRAAAD